MLTARLQGVRVGASGRREAEKQMVERDGRQPITLASYQAPLLNRKGHRISSAGSEAHKEITDGENDFKRLKR